MKSKAIRKSVSAIICIAMLFALMPAFAIGAGAEETITEISLSFPIKIVEVGYSQPLIITDQNGDAIDPSELTFTSSAPEIATVNADGEVTGEALGRAEITATNGVISDTVEVAVVGVSLLRRHGVNHGEFENDIRLSDGSNGVSLNDTFWTASKGSGYFIYDYNLQRNATSPITGRLTNIASASVNEATPATRRVTIAGIPDRHDPSSTNHWGLIEVDKNKLYEFSYWENCENATTLPLTSTFAETYYFKGYTSGDYITTFAHYPWRDLEPELSEIDWTRFCPPVAAINWDHDIIGILPRINTTCPDALQFTLNIAHAAVCEVVYDRLDFAPASSVTGLSTGDKVSTTVTHYTNTGNTIIPGDATKPIAVEYSSSNTNVATVSATGEITAVGEGEAQITATAEIAGVTKSSSITVTVEASDYSGVTQTFTFAGPTANVRELTSYDGRDWAYYADTCSGSVNRYRDCIQANVSGIGEWLALKLNVAEAGTYKTLLKHLMAYPAGNFYVYLIPFADQTTEQITAALTSANLISSTVYGYRYPEEPSEIWLLDVSIPTAGEYLIVFKCSQKGAGSGYNMYPIELVLDGIVLGSATIEFDKSEIEIDETATATVTALMNDGITPATGYTIDGYTSSNEAVATVDSSGVVTGVAAGTAEITVFVTLDGVTVTATSTITVTAPVVLSSIAVTTPPNKTVYKTGEALDITGLVVTGTYSDSSTEVLSVTADNITGFDSSTDAPSQTLTVTVDGKTATFDVKVVRVLDSSYATGSITVDGNANEPAWSINHNIPANTGDNTATFGTLWDEDYLYVYVDVVDDVLVNNSNKHYYDDCVEIYIDGDMVKGEYNSHCAQYTFRYGDATKYVHPVSTASTDGVEHISRATESGYAVELKIPWSSIGGLTVEEGKTIGFTVHVNDKDTTDNPAGKEEDIIFYTVDSPNEDYQDSTNWAEMTLTAWQNPVEETESTGTVSIGAEGAPAGAITATVNGIPVDITNPGDLTLGDVVEMNADPEPDAGKEFLFWMDPVSKRLVSNQQEVTFTVGTNTQITAVYKDAGQGHIVIFFDKNGKVLSNEYLADGASITAPENPYSVGYIFSGWSPAVPATANGDYAFVAQYTDDPAMYTVAVENGSISPAGGSYKYNTLVTVTAGDFESGRKFAYWTKNGVIVSYASTYSFYVWDDTEICAVSVPEAETVSPAPAIYMDDNVKNDGGSGRLIFASERTLPAGYTLIETGILISELNSNPDLDNCDEKAVAQSESGSGQFTARVDGLASDDSRYARAYMIYKTPEGEYKVIYSNAVIGTV